MNFIVILIAILPIFAGKADAQTRKSLFDGKSLAGWHTQGNGIWTVSGGAIHARNPPKDWAHLISDQPFANGHVRIRFLNRAGNSGLYVRGSEGGSFGHKGMQVDIGAPHKDGSVMRVTDTAYAWLAEITKAVDSGWLRPAEWNELSVDMQGSGLKTYINGRLIWSGTAVAGIAATGLLALQLHSGDDNDISFKDIDVFTPSRIPFCPVPGDPAYKPGNDPDSSLCRPVTLILPGNRRSGIRAASGIPSMGFPSSGSHAPECHWTTESHGSLFDLRGARLRAFPIPAPTETPMRKTTP